jgi:hypothetical protein
LGNNRTRFRVRESTVADPNWDPETAIELWQRMLSKRLQDLVTLEPENQSRE